VPSAQSCFELFSFFFTVDIFPLMIHTHFHLKVTLIRSTNDEGEALFRAFSDLVDRWIEKYFPLFLYVKDEVSDLRITLLANLWQQQKKEVKWLFCRVRPSIVFHSTAVLLRVALSSAGRWCYCCLDSGNDKMEAP
jgi:hypothetical protein